MDGCVQCFVKRSEFVVHDYPQRHERLGGCVKASRTRPGWDCCCDGGCELGCGCDGLLLSCCRNCSCDSSCPPFPSVLPEDPYQLLFRQRIDQIGRGGLQARVHPHVQRPVQPKAESTSPCGQLFERCAAVEQDPVHRANTKLVEYHLQSSVVVVDQSHPPMAGKTLSCSFNRLGISVDPDQPSFRADAFENRFRMSARPDRRIYHYLARLACQVLQYFSHHHRPMNGRLLPLLRLGFTRHVKYRARRPSP